MLLAICILAVGILCANAFKEHDFKVSGSSCGASAETSPETQQTDGFVVCAELVELVAVIWCVSCVYEPNQCWLCIAMPPSVFLAHQPSDLLSLSTSFPA